MILRKFKVSGHSMQPYLHEGQYVLVATFLGFKMGDVVVFKQSSKVFIKRITKVNKDTYLVEGDNKNDSLHIGKILKRDIIGKVIFKI